MAEVLSHTISDVRLRCRDHELDVSDLDERLARKFHAQNYNHLATRNDLGYGYTDFQICTLQGGGDVVQGELAPCSFYIKLAYMDLVSDNGGARIADLPSPRIANVGLLTAVCYQAQSFLLAQIKGKAIDRGQLLIAAAAGKIDPADMVEPDPLVAALGRELNEELGIASGDLDISPFHYAVSEWESGNINHSCLARNANLNRILDCFLARTEQALILDNDRDNLEVAALALVPLDGGACGPCLDDIVTFTPVDGDIRTSIASFSPTCYTSAITGHLQKTSNRNCLLERAGL